KEGQLLAIYKNIGYGEKGFGFKYEAGDNKSPIGKYKIIEKGWSHNYLKLLIGYPNDEQIACPRQDRKLGGLIELHGPLDVTAKTVAKYPKLKLVERIFGNNEPAAGPWTQGCISVTKAQIAQIYRALGPNCIVEIGLEEYGAHPNLCPPEHDSPAVVARKNP